MMHTLYNIVSGPMTWLAFVVFLGGSIYRIWSMSRLLVQKEKSLLTHLSLRYGLRSLAHWLTPFATRNMRMHPAMTVVSFAFHICLLLVPIFLLAHIVLWEEAWGISLWALPEGLADVMTIIVVAACLFFAVRRMLVPEVRFVSGGGDYLFLGVVALPFITGYYCAQQWPGYPAMMIAHMLSGQLMLAIIPFTRLSHMLFMWFTRFYIGSEFGSVRHAKDY